MFKIYSNRIWLNKSILSEKLNFKLTVNKKKK